MSASSSFSFLPQGALFQKFQVEGHDIILGFPDPEPYHSAAFFGETIGRVANRIVDGKIQNLNGKSYQLVQNNGPNTLHGGTEGWGKKQFSGPHSTTRNGKDATKFVYVSPDGDEGFPGTVELRVWYITSEEDEGGVKKTVLTSEYEAEFVGDECEETAINVTNHSYFTVSDAPKITGTVCNLATVKSMVVDENATPNHEIEDFPGITANKDFELGPEKPDIDHCLILDPSDSSFTLDTRKRNLQRLVTLSHPVSKLHLEVSSTEPAFQFYTGKFLDQPATDKTPAMGPRGGICIEPSRYIDAINVPEWRDQVLMKKGQVYGAKNVYKAWKA